MTNDVEYADLSARDDLDPAHLMRKSLDRIETEIRANDETIKKAMLDPKSPEEYRAAVRVPGGRNQVLFVERDRLRGHLAALEGK